MRHLLAVIAVASLVACAPPGVTEQQAVQVAKDRVGGMVKDKMLPSGIEQSPMTVQKDGEKYLVDFKNEKLNIWVVAIVHSDGTTEISKTEIK